MWQRLKRKISFLNRLFVCLFFFCHPHFSFFPSYFFCYPHFFPSAFFHPHPPSAGIRSAFYRHPFEPRYCLIFNSKFVFQAPHAVIYHGLLYQRQCLDLGTVVMWLVVCSCWQVCRCACAVRQSPYYDICSRQILETSDWMTRDQRFVVQRPFQWSLKGMRDCWRAGSFSYNNRNQLNSAPGHEIQSFFTSY